MLNPSAPLRGPLSISLDAIVLGVLQSFPYIIHGKGHVMDPLPLVGNEFADRPLRIGRPKKFNLGLSYLKKAVFTFWSVTFFYGITFQSVNFS